MMTTSFLPLKPQTTKLLHRWYLTPVKLHHIIKTSGSLCWKDCGTMADYLHCCWSCPKLQDVWIKISDEVYKMTNFCLQLCPEVFLLNIWPDNVPRTLGQTLSTILTLAKLELASKWNDSSIPSLAGWHDHIWNCFIMAKITDKVLRKTHVRYKSTLEDVWSPVLQYLEEFEIIPPRVFNQFLHHY